MFPTSRDVGGGDGRVNNAVASGAVGEEDNGGLVVGAHFRELEAGRTVLEIVEIIKINFEFPVGIGFFGNGPAAFGNIGIIGGNVADAGKLPLHPPEAFGITTGNSTVAIIGHSSILTHAVTDFRTDCTFDI